MDYLKAKLLEFKDKQYHCDHIWDEVQYEPEILEIMGQEVNQIYDTIPRWSRICKKCGKKQYTYNQEVIIIKNVRRRRAKF